MEVPTQHCTACHTIVEYQCDFLLNLQWGWSDQQSVRTIEMELIEIYKAAS